MIWIGDLRAVGLLPYFFDEADPRSARDQLHESYAHGGGVQPFEGFTPSIDRESPLRSILQYPDDPPLWAIGWSKMREELVLVFPYAWVAIVQPTGETLVTRVD